MLKMTSVKKNYRDFTLDCTLEIKPGYVTGLVGRNGAGKTTAFKSVLGLISVDGGEIEIFGKKLSDFKSKDKEKIGVLLSDSGFSGELKVNDIIPVLSAVYSQFDKEDFLKKCKQMKLPLNKKIKEFSTGMKARLKLIIAITHNADLLILDEPTAGMDVMARESIIDMLREYMEQGERAILISSHISGDLEGLCDDIYMIDNGKIILHQDTDVILSSYGILKLRDEEYRKLDKSHILKIKKENFGVSCLTDEKQFYLDNYPGIVVERGGIDSVITMMIGGENP
ncbi:MAG TPA: ABC transporter ATP-binding protein [Candidatus Limousia pullorum]|uniref:ABC transporter ATP-binding protein n=1 Tax=Candidatus Limousia pullorum TaxID=2840860 RepID=A0A9D1S7U0_9FIRM|nr:ABC transporter ATP-binding protein [Candidatus Limousia pullorum]